MPSKLIFYAISRLTVNISHLFKWFNKVNNGKEWSKQIKPFNFYHIGFQVVEEEGKSVKPLCPF